MCLGRIKKKRAGEGRVKDKIISNSLRFGIYERYLGMQKNWRSEAFGFERFESTGRASEVEGLSLENLGESLSAAAGVCTSRKVQAMEEGDVEGRHGAAGAGEVWEEGEMRGSQTLSHEEKEKA